MVHIVAGDIHHDGRLRPAAAAGFQQFNPGAGDVGLGDNRPQAIHNFFGALAALRFVGQCNINLCDIDGLAGTADPFAGNGTYAGIRSDQFGQIFWIPQQRFKLLHRPIGFLQARARGHFHRKNKFPLIHIRDEFPADIAGHLQGSDE
ncbi:MAG: hypothetical protein BWY71_02053 [Planctomycetes bacterium ADurb.Bin412]|nr:MAG: hypothetical protein BWY71_02053 [Planctomycetes bacterium ADurb.Bin412]